MNLAWFFLTILILLILWSAHRSRSTLFIFLRFLLYRKYHLYWGWEPASVRLSYQNINWVGKAGLLAGWTEGSADRPFRTYTYLFFKFDNSSKDARKAPSVWSRFENCLRSWECKGQSTHVFHRRSRCSGLFGPFWITVIFRYFCALSVEASLTDKVSCIVHTRVRTLAAFILWTRPLNSAINGTTLEVT